MMSDESTLKWILRTAGVEVTSLDLYLDLGCVKINGHFFPMPFDLATAVHTLTGDRAQ